MSLSNKAFNFNDMKGIKFILIILFIIIIINIAYVFFSKFQKTITVKNKYTTSTNNNIIYTIVDSENNIYTIENVWFFADFDKAQNYNSININSKYNVTGYGYTLNMLSIYPSIYNFTSA